MLPCVVSGKVIISSAEDVFTLRVKKVDGVVLDRSQVKTVLVQILACFPILQQVMLLIPKTLIGTVTTVASIYAYVKGSHFFCRVLLDTETT